MLSEKRQYSETGPQPIPMSEILAYVTYNEVKGEAKREDLLRIISALDKTFIQYFSDKRSKEASQQKAKNAGLKGKR